MTQYLTLYPGDVIWMGTDGASPDLKHGDVVEVEITGIGTLRNRFVKEYRSGKQKRMTRQRQCPLHIDPGAANCVRIQF